MITQLKRYGIPLATLGTWGTIMLLIPSPQPPTSTELAEVAVGYIKGNYHSQAINTLEQALEQEPNNYRANFVAGLYQTDLKQFEIAERYLRAAVNANPKQADARLALGVALQSQRRYVDAASVYLELRALEPLNPKAVYNLGMLYIRTWDYARAKSCLEEYLRLSPKAIDREFVTAKINELNERLRMGR